MTSRFTLRQLEFFVAVADAGSVSGAAEACGASQAGVSLAIRDLERHLGVQLLVRRRAKGAALTEAGSKMIADARRLLEGADALQSLASATDSRVSGTISIGCYVTLAPFLIPPLLDDFASRHPDLEVRVFEEAAGEIRDALLDGRCELGFLYANDGGSGLDSITVQTTRPYLILSADHPLATQDQISLAEVADSPLIMFDVPSARNAAKMLADAGLTANIRHLSQNIEVVRGLVARGIGYSIMVQQWPSDTSFEGRPIVSRPIADDIPERSAVLAWPERSRLTRRAKAVVEFFRSCPPR
ncbi:LysR family transcriptional regulator [Streptomyces chartreusis]|uniref:LysR family transcriptional regulator n=1 Tax=Streptomyces chartreusis TaxID=1969 RepID=A0A7I0Y8W4_STRCX|nr:LysR family transcriptional regulator [Streptomyces chartreusis]QKZ15945.1 LysR family transcriptional regulator [Streptomyces chartreusis]